MRACLRAFFRTSFAPWPIIGAVILTLVGSVARADTVEITDDHGGFLFLYTMRWEKLAAQGVSVRINGPCLSACTVILGYIPRKKICATDKASLGFHLATMQFATDQLWQIYPEDIRKWITAHGGLTYQVMWMQVPEIFHFVQKCT